MLGAIAVILNNIEQEFLDAFFSSYLGKIFFLTGGTALAAFYLQHRLSEDLDLFTTDQEVDFAAVSLEMNRMNEKLNIKIKHQISSPSFLQYILIRDKDSLKVDIVKDVPIHFGRVRTINRVRVDSLENISVGKLLALFGRADPKDFVDLYFLFTQKKISFRKLFQMAKKKDLGLNEFYLAEMISRVSDIKIFPATIKPFDQEDLTKLFLKLSNKLYQQIRPEGI